MKSLFTAIACTLAGSMATAQQVPILISRTSGAFIGYPGDQAADGNPGTSWNSGGAPTQWIEIDLKKDRNISRLRMLPAQSPDGMTTHVVYGRTSSNAMYLLGTKSSYTSDNQWITLDTTDPLRAVQYLLVQTTQSPSWVAWREFEAWDGGAFQYSCLAAVPAGWVVANTTIDPGTCPQTSEHIRFTFRDLSNQPSGMEAQVCSAVPAGWTLISQWQDSSACLGYQNSANGMAVSNVFKIKKN
jgi:uncharacterized protein YbdZ (MbtH family)